MKLFFSITILIFSFGAIAQKSTVKYPPVTSEIITKLKTSDAVDMVLYKSGKSMEFNGKNVQLPVSFIEMKKVSNLDSMQSTGLMMYKLKGASLMDAELLVSPDKSKMVIKLKSPTKNFYYSTVSENSMGVIRKWLE
jgi:hypothetical protein